MTAASFGRAAFAVRQVAAVFPSKAERESHLRSYSLLFSSINLPFSISLELIVYVEGISG